MSKLIHNDHPRAKPRYDTVHALPKGFMLYDATANEKRIIKLYEAEIRKLIESEAEAKEACRRDDPLSMVGKRGMKTK